MSITALNTADSHELEDLFDSIALAPRAPGPAPVRAAPQAALEVVPLPAGTGDETHSDSACPANKVINSVGLLTRQLHDTLAELGYARQLEEAAADTLPDARQRLAYVVTLTEQAASRALNAVDIAMPLQEELAAGAASLARGWDGIFDGASNPEELRKIAQATRDYLHTVPKHAGTTRAQLREIVMAQEFQDLTGQVLKRITELAANLETQLLTLLVEHSPAPIRRTEALGLLNGPHTGGHTADVVANQAQVDELLESLGF